MDLRNPRHLAIVVATLLAAAFLLTLRTACPITFDESVTLLQVSGNAEPEWPERAVPAAVLKTNFLHQTGGFWEVAKGLVRVDIHPPVYYWLLWLWRQVFGPSLYSARVMSVCISVVTVLMLFYLCRRWRYWWIAGVVFALGGAIFRDGMFARNYALTRLLLVLMAWFASKAAAPSTAILIGVFGALAFAAHYFALFPVIGLLTVYAFLNRKRGGAGALTPLAVFSVCALPLLPIMLGVSDMRPHQFVGFRGLLMESVYAFRGLAMQLVSQPHQIGLWLGRAAIVLAGVVTLGLAALAVRSSGQLPLVRLVAAAAAAHVSGTFLLFAVTERTLVKNFAAPRYFGLVAPLLALLMAAGFEGMTDLRGKIATGLALGLLLGIEGLSRERCYETNDIVKGRVPSAATVVVGEGPDRGGPGVIAYQVPEDARICVVRREESCIEESITAEFFVPFDPPGAKSVEGSFMLRCRQCRVLREQDRGN